ncbi:sulfate transporter family-domain-containing protein, partial [Thamnocephalis sphaerospora]
MRFPRVGESPRSWWAQWRHRIAYYIPVLAWLPNYGDGGLSTLVGDMVAGISVACLMVPQSLSYAGLAGLSPMQGMWTAFAPAFVYSLLGTSRQLSVGPGALVAILVNAAITQAYISQGMLHPDSPTLAELAAILAILVGLFNLLLGLCRLGFLDSVLSRAMLHGFIYGVGFVICIGQLVPLLGLTKFTQGSLAGNASALETSVWLSKNIHHTHVLTAVVGFSCIAFLLAARIIKKQVARRRPRTTWPQLIPEILIVVVGAIIISTVLRLEQRGLAVLGEVPNAGQLPKIRWPPVQRLQWSQFRALATSAALIAVLGFVESVAVTKQYAAKRHYTVSANRDLVAFGLANLCGGLFGAFPAFGSIARTKINDKAGARTQLAGMITALCSLAAALLLLPYLWSLPRAALAGVVFTAALGLIIEAPRQLRFIIRLHAWRDLALIASVFLATVLVSVEAGTLFVVAASIILVIRHTT